MRWGLTYPYQQHPRYIVDGDFLLKRSTKQELNVSTQATWTNFQLTITKIE